jgi:hypothetical protein
MATIDPPVPPEFDASGAGVEPPQPAIPINKPNPSVGSHFVCMRSPLYVIEEPRTVPRAQIAREVVKARAIRSYHISRRSARQLVRNSADSRGHTPALLARSGAQIADAQKKIYKRIPDEFFLVLASRIERDASVTERRFCGHQPWEQKLSIRRLACFGASLPTRSPQHRIRVSRGSFGALVRPARRVRRALPSWSVVATNLDSVGRLRALAATKDRSWTQRRC